MFTNKKNRKLAAGLSIFSILLLLAGATQVAKAQGVDADVHKALDNKRFQNVQVSVHGPDVVLTGTVDLYEDKELADNRVHHVHGVHGVENDIQVAGPAVEDTTLRDKLAKALALDRVGYGTTSFNSITLGVHNGVVTLGGNVYWPPDKDSAVGLVANTPGVKDIVDNIDVAPVSPMDDQLRLQLSVPSTGLRSCRSMRSILRNPSASPSSTATSPSPEWWTTRWTTTSRVSALTLFREYSKSSTISRSRRPGQKVRN